MSDPNETLIVCPDNDDKLIDTFAIIVGVLTGIGAVFGYFLQQRQERNEAIKAKIKEDDELDRDQALERAQKQLSVLIGPLHRLWKTQNTIHLQWRKHIGLGLQDFQTMNKKKGNAYWTTMFPDDFLQPYIEDPHSYEAVLYRNFISRRLKPVYIRIRELVLAHMSDLADMPSQEEWLQMYSIEDVKSPYVGSVNINVIFDTYTAWTFEFDDIVESWAEGDFRRMQPTTVFAGLICNNLVDTLFEKAKEKEARYNKHVSLHKNIIQKELEATPRENKTALEEMMSLAHVKKKWNMAINSIITQEGGEEKEKEITKNKQEGKENESA